MTGAVQSVALEGRPGCRARPRGHEVHASPQEVQALLPPTPLEMHKVGAVAAGAGGLGLCPGAARTHQGLQIGPRSPLLTCCPLPTDYLGIWSSVVFQNCPYLDDTHTYLQCIMGYYF